jgi:uncharacterized protein with HEPN domain
MPFDPVQIALRDILRHIDLAGQLIEGFDAGLFAGDLRTLYAVTRCLEIISEASRRLPEGMKARHASIEWRQIAAAGNVYRHQYEDVAPAQVWATVTTDLPRLREVVGDELGRMSG